MTQSVGTDMIDDRDVPTMYENVTVNAIRETD